MELQFDVRGNNFADLRKQADEVVRTFIGDEHMAETERHYAEVEGTMVDVSSPASFRLIGAGFYANVRSVIR